VLPYAVQSNVTSGLFLNESVPADMVTVGVGVDDQFRSVDIQTEVYEDGFRFMPSPQITGVDQNGFFGLQGKVVGAQVPALDEVESG
jgi:hypothetical protein